MGAHPYPAQDETTALEGLMERAWEAGRASRRWRSRVEHLFSFGKSHNGMWLDAEHIVPLSGSHNGAVVQGTILTADEHQSLATFTSSGSWASLRDTLVFLNACPSASDASDTQDRHRESLESYIERRIGSDQARHPKLRRRAETCQFGRWAIQHAKDLARRRRLRADVASPRKFLERWMTDVAGKASEWSYVDAGESPISSPADPRLLTLFHAMLLALAPPAKRIFFVLDAYRRDLRATVSSIALVASRSREIVPTRSATPRSARPTTRNLCVVRRRPTVDRALRRARMSAAPLAAPAPHAAARASEIRSTSALRGSPRRRLRSPGGAMARAVIAA